MLAVVTMMLALISTVSAGLPLAGGDAPPTSWPGQSSPSIQAGKSVYVIGEDASVSVTGRLPAGCAGTSGTLGFYTRTPSDATPAHRRWQRFK